MGSFTKGMKLQPAKLKRFKFPLPELGNGTFIWLRALSAPEVRKKLATEENEAEKQAAGYELISLCAIDEAGERLFTDAADAEENLDVAAESILGMVEKILDLSGLNKDRSKN